MAQVTKKELKAILKECLQEILKEQGVVLAESTSRNGNTSRVSADDIVTTENKRPPTVVTPLMETVDRVAAPFALKGGAEADMMRSILADTAATTLQEQQAHGHSVGQGAGVGAGGMPVVVGDIAMPTSPQQVAKERGELSSLISGGDTTMWAKIAFASKGSN